MVGVRGPRRAEARSKVNRERRQAEGPGERRVGESIGCDMTSRACGTFMLEGYGMKSNAGRYPTREC